MARATPFEALPQRSVELGDAVLAGGQRFTVCAVLSVGVQRLAGQQGWLQAHGQACLIRTLARIVWAARRRCLQGVVSFCDGGADSPVLQALQPQDAWREGLALLCTRTPLACSVARMRLAAAQQLSRRACA